MNNAIGRLSSIRGSPQHVIRAYYLAEDFAGMWQNCEQVIGREVI